MRRPVTRWGTIRGNNSLFPGGQGSTPASSASTAGPNRLWEGDTADPAWRYQFQGLGLVELGDRAVRHDCSFPDAALSVDYDRRIRESGEPRPVRFKIFTERPWCVHLPRVPVSLRSGLQEGRDVRMSVLAG
jgi:hypothetical protein